MHLCLLRFGIRIAGSFLSWGRGKTRDSAIDAAIRAAFALVAAHGYDDYTMTDDCFTEEPVDNFMGGMPPVSWFLSIAVPVSFRLKIPGF